MNLRRQLRPRQFLKTFFEFGLSFEYCSVDGMALYQTVQGLLKSFLFRKSPDEKKSGFDGFIEGS